jgi:hypothetical protein
MRDRQLLNHTHFKADAAVLGDIIELPPRQIAVKIELSIVKEMIDRSDVRLSGSVAGGQTTLGLRGKKLIGIFFTHPSNGHSAQASTASSLPAGPEAVHAALM